MRINMAHIAWCSIFFDEGKGIQSSWTSQQKGKSSPKCWTERCRQCMQSLTNLGGNPTACLPPLESGFIEFGQYPWQHLSHSKGSVETSFQNRIGILSIHCSQWSHLNPLADVATSRLKFTSFWICIRKQPTVSRRRWLSIFTNNQRQNVD